MHQLNQVIPLSVPFYPTLIDSFGREIRYLRLSITDSCNFRCRYCRPAQGSERIPNKERLSMEEILRLTRLFVELGVKRVRLTGGEPLVFPKIIELIHRLAAIPGLDELTLSTNAFLLGPLAQSLHEAGLSRVNISLDSLEEKTFAWITRSGKLAQVIAGIDAALAAKLRPVKLNMVVIGGINDHEIPAMVIFARERGVVLRFIEAMPVGKDGGAIMGRFVSAESIMERIRTHFAAEFMPTSSCEGLGPARYHRVMGLGVDVGIISAMSRHFCETCNRVRLTSEGKLVLCLGRTEQVDLRIPLRSGATDMEMRQHILHAISLKPDHHQFHQTVVPNMMSSLGG